MRSDNMPRPFAPEHGEEAASQLQRDIEQVDNAMLHSYAEDRAAWQRIRTRLTPDRERVARALYQNNRFPISDPAWEDLREGTKEMFLSDADAAIAAMGETP